MYTFNGFGVERIGMGTHEDLLENDREAVDVSLLRSVPEVVGANARTQQFGRSPQKLL